MTGLALIQAPVSGAADGDEAGHEVGGGPLSASQAHALTLVAPRGLWVTRVELRHNHADETYNANRDKTPLGGVFSGVNLDASIVPSLALLGPGRSLGTTALDSDTQVDRAEITLGYGVTDRLTLGVIANFGSSLTHANFSAGGGNVGFNPAFDPNQAIGIANFPFAPVGGAIAPLDSAGVQRILTDPVFGYGYEAIADTRVSGGGNVLIGGLYRLFEDQHQQWVGGLGLRRSLAKDNNPDNLFDNPLDDGSDDLVFELDYLRRWGADLAGDSLLGGNLDLRLTAKRTVQLPDTLLSRVPAAGQVLATAASKETLERNLGDFWEYDMEVGKVVGNWRYSATWHRYQKAADRYSSARGQDVSSLIAGSSQSANQWRAAISWSGIQAWRAGRVPLPLIVRLEMQETYAGHNFPDLRDWYLTLTSFF